MAKLALNKSTLNREGKNLKSYRQFVPALDLKRKQLMAARVKIRNDLLAFQQTLDTLKLQIKEEFSVLATAEIDVGRLVKVEAIELDYYNLVGLQLPKLGRFCVEPQEYSKLATPLWFDALVLNLEQSVKLEAEVMIAQRQLCLLDEGLRKTTQRLNLFDKVLIPTTEKNIRKIKIALSDAERAGVVRAKIAKNKRRRLAFT
ncbi:V-type ATP synthase subunit D [Neptunomonas japonica]|uniref:V-type H+-transporting ATPase subunit D n=1 Tax=Neptunomonas japonica JAMM 1380 TaxID=1441457 RepID=A0A7R6PHL2_9GAMM|nr:V-type ATP synthase subunit D [Neptunomonas japonica]BBB28421.1 V-type H+-transporting ATPase subunit D [Neptunomonas japonica JAMM 1380]